MKYDRIYGQRSPCLDTSGSEQFIRNSNLRPHSIPIWEDHSQSKTGVERRGIVAYLSWIMRKLRLGIRPELLLRLLVESLSDLLLL